MGAAQRSARARNSGEGRWTNLSFWRTRLRLGNPFDKGSSTIHLAFEWRADVPNFFQATMVRVAWHQQRLLSTLAHWISGDQDLGNEEQYERGHAWERQQYYLVTPEGPNRGTCSARHAAFKRGTWIRLRAATVTGWADNCAGI